MTQIRLLKVDPVDGVATEHDQTDELTLGSFSVSGGGPTMGVSGLDMNDTDIWDVQDLVFVDPATSTINQTAGLLTIDNIMAKDRDNVMETDSGVLFPTVIDDPDEVDILRLPTVSGVPTATPSNGGGGYILLNSVNNHVYVWTGSEWDDLSTVETAEAVDENYLADGAVAERDVVYISSSDHVLPAQADADVTSQALGFATMAGIAEDIIPVRSKGILEGFSGLSAGNRYFLSATVAGAVQNTVPSGSGQTIVQVGYAKSATEMHVQIQSLGRRFKSV